VRGTPASESRMSARPGPTEATHTPEHEASGVTVERTPTPSDAAGQPAPFAADGVDHYLLGAEIARGSRGRVLSARDAWLDRPVAIKQLLRPSAELARRFQREALITARLQHPSIVPVYEAGRLESGELFYAMKLVSGRPLRALIDER